MVNLEDAQRCQQELADAMVAGAQKRPQSFGSYFSHDGRSCALGAVYEGVYLLPRDVGDTTPRGLGRIFECLDQVVRPCPHGCLKAISLPAMIVHLNDDHHPQNLTAAPSAT